MDGCTLCDDSTVLIRDVCEIEEAHPHCEGCKQPLFDAWYKWNVPDATPRVCSPSCYTIVTGLPYKASYAWDGGFDGEAEAEED